MSSASVSLVRSPRSSAQSAFGALLLRDLAVLRKEIWMFLGRTVMQPLLLIFVFAYVFPKIGQQFSTGTGTSFATILVPGLVGTAMIFNGISAVALPLALFFLQDRLVFHPQPVGDARRAEIAAAFPAARQVFVEAADGTRLHAWQLGDGPDLMLYFGGNAEEVSGMLGEAAAAVPEVEDVDVFEAVSDAAVETGDERVAEESAVAATPSRNTVAPLSETTSSPSIGERASENSSEALPSPAAAPLIRSPASGPASDSSRMALINAVACSVSSIECAVEFVPVPATTLARSPIASSTVSA